MTDRDRLLRLLAGRSVRRGDFTLASGVKSSYYLDARRTTTHAEGQWLAGRLVLGAIRGAGLGPDAVGGLTMGADPLAYAIAHASHGEGPAVHAFSVRKEPKGHGSGRVIEGCFASGDRVVVVEDVVTSGKSALRAARAVAGAGGTVLAVAALVDREEGGAEAIRAAGYHLIPLFLAWEVLAAAELPPDP
ncbi:MAG: orotate phosphoribosyltransferase [Longimicrobiaceae bacterium]